MLPVLAVAGVRVLPGKDSGRDARSGAPYLPVPVPCDQAVQDLSLTIAMSEVYADSTFGASAVDAYACQPGWSMTGPEHVYILTADVDLIADLWLTANVPNDHDLILLGDCDSDSCLTQSNSELSVQLTAGTTVYLVVDGFNGASGDYELVIETHPIGIPDLVCNGGAQLLDIAGAGSQADADSLNTRPNLVSLYDCAPYTIRGGEKWYAMTIAAADTDTVGTGYGEALRVVINATTASETLDLALWIFADCGPEAECLAFADIGNAGEEEILEWTNSLPDVTTVYLAVDCLRPPEDGVTGAFALTVTSTVPVATQSITNVRNRFR